MYHVSGGNNKIEHITNVFLNAETDLEEANSWKEKIICILKKVPSKADALKPAIQFLIGTLSPAKIYMMQHSAQEDTTNKYFDLLVVMPSSSPSFTEYEAALNIAYLIKKDVRFSLHNEGNVLEKLKLGHPFYTLNFTAENIVYDNHRTIYPVANPQQAAFTRQLIGETFMKGFAKAKHFYTCAKKNITTGKKRLCYSCCIRRRN